VKKLVCLTVLVFLSQTSPPLLANQDDCTKVANIERPMLLPDRKTCTVTDPSGCNGWKALGVLQPADLKFPGTAYLFMATKEKSSCFYLHRDNPKEKLNGVLCYNTENCHICAYDAKGLPTEIAELETGYGVKDNCARCHTPGPLLPKEKIWKMGRPHMGKLNKLCSSSGGPVWVNAPSSWLQRDSARRIEAPKKCASCHSHFMKGGEFCAQAATSFGDGGAMKKYYFDLTEPDEVAACKKFRADMECDDEFPCE